MKPGADSKRVVPIVTGFLGRGEKTGLITTLGRGGLGAFCTLVPIRPRRRGGRRSLRTLPGASLRPPLAFNPRLRRLSTSTDAFQLQLTPFNSTPTFARMETTLRPHRDGDRRRVERPGGASVEGRRRSPLRGPEGD